MRKIFCDSLVAQAARREFVFLTGDLGFMALEPLRDAMGARFINAGVAEQNMVAVAGGMARHGLRAWTYSIAPFMYARPFEHIRNDVCLPNLPVTIVGNGGGYGYGVMGATHHALEDYGIMLSLQNMRAFVPAFDSDVAAMIPMLMDAPHPSYLRLGLSELPKDVPSPAYAQCRKMLAGNDKVIVVVGPMVGSIFDAARQLPEGSRPTIWLVSDLPVLNYPDEMIADLKNASHIRVVEEHVASGSFGQAFAADLLKRGMPVRRFSHHVALGYPSHTYGSQKFHRAECGLDPVSVLKDL